MTPLLGTGLGDVPAVATLPSSPVVFVEAGGLRTVQAGRLRASLQQPDSKDSLGNGALIGALTGVAALATWMSITYGHPLGGEDGDYTVVPLMFGAAVGAGIGILVDALRH